MTSQTRRPGSVVGRIAVLASGAALALTGIVPAAAAQPTGSLGGGPGSSIGAAAPAEAPLDQIGDGSPAAVESYWTEDRMRQAAPMEQVEEGGEPAGGVAPSPGPEARDGGMRPATDRAAAQPRVGKVFFTLGGRDYVCSASSVKADNRNLVATAGHCVHNQGQWVSRFVFVPAYEDGRAPYGRFSGVRASAPGGWLSGQNLSSDTGFVKVAPVNGRSLADTVGTFGLAFNYDRNQNFTAYGYPAQAPFDGRRLFSCSGPDSPNADRLGIADCTMNGGASGGPWIGMGGRQVSNNSYILENRSGIYGPYWGQEILDTYRSVQGD